MRSERGRAWLEATERTVERAVGALLRRRLLAAALLLALTGLGLAGASRVEVDGSIESWFLDDDASLARYRAFRDRFGSDEFVVVAAFGDEALAPAGLAAVERMRRGAEALPQVARTRWLTNVTTAEPVGDDAIDVGPLAPAIPTTAEDAAALVGRASARSVARGLVSRDPPATAVLVELTREAQTIDGKLALVDGLRQVIARERGPLEVVLSGPPAFDEAFVRHTERDLGALGPIALALIFGVVVVATRRAGLAAVPVAVVAAAVTWTLGGMGLAGLRVNLVSGNLVVLMLAVGVAEAIHLVGEYRVQAAAAADRAEAAARAAGAVFVPCAFTALTTVLGMLSLVTSEVRPIREFGLLAAAGVTLCFVATFTVGPLLLSCVSPGAPPVARAFGPARLARIGRGAQVTIVAGVGLALALACLGLARLEVGVNPVEYFRRDDPLRRATERVDATLGGTASIELQLEAPGAGLERPAVLARVAALRDTLERERGVSYSQSILDPLADAHRVWADAPAGALPTSADLVAQYYLLLEAEDDVARLLRPDHGAGRLSLRTQMSMVDRPLEVIQRVDRHTRSPELQGDDLRVQVTGYVHLMATMYDYLLRSQIESALLAIPMVTAAMLLLLRRPSLGLLALLPNVLPLVAALGLMGWLGIRLDVGTVMVGSITLGIVVDDTVHLLTRLREHLRGCTRAAVPDALERALAEVGPPMVVTSLAFAAGFGALAFGSFLVNVYFGLLSATVVLAALACELLVTPALVLLLPGWFAPDTATTPPAPPPHVLGAAAARRDEASGARVGSLRNAAVSPG